MPAKPLHLLSPQPGQFHPQIFIHMVCSLCSFSPCPFTFQHLPLPWPSKPKGIEEWEAPALPITCVFMVPIFWGHHILFCHLGFLYVIWFRSVGEKRAPQKKVLSWKRQRMQESRCQSRSTSSLSLEISTTICGGPLPPRSGTLQSRWVSFYSKIHPYSWSNTFSKHQTLWHDEIPNQIPDHHNGTNFSTHGHKSTGTYFFSISALSGLRTRLF